MIKTKVGILQNDIMSYCQDLKFLILIRKRLTI